MWPGQCTDFIPSANDFSLPVDEKVYIALFFKHCRLTVVQLGGKNRLFLIEEIEVVSVSLGEQLHDVLAVSGREVCTHSSFSPTLSAALRPSAQFPLFVEGGTCPVTTCLS